MDDKIIQHVIRRTKIPLYLPGSHYSTVVRAFASEVPYWEVHAVYERGHFRFVCAVIGPDGDRHAVL